MNLTKWRTCRILIAAAAGITIIIGSFSIIIAIEENEAHFVPDYPKVNIKPVLMQKTLSKADYKMLFYQTGLGKNAIDELRNNSQTSTQSILHIQDSFFRDVKYICEKNTLISMEEALVDEKGNYMNGTELVSLHNGYILLTKASQTIGWRNGHAALVIDAENGKTLESVVLGTNSCVQDISKWTIYPNFMLFKLKGASSELLNNISQSALINMNDIPYDFSVGLLSPKLSKSGIIDKTQCSHLVWSAFRLFGYDLDSNGGMIVTPKDIANSPYLEVVQVFGVNPKKIWP